MLFRTYIFFFIAIIQCSVISMASPLAPIQQELAVKNNPKLINSQAKRILILTQNFQSHYATVAKSITLSSLQNTYEIKISNIADWKQADTYQLIICLGIAPLETIAKRKVKTPVLAGLITSYQWSKLNKDISLPNNYHAIFHDAPIARQLVLAKLLVSNIQDIGIITSNNYGLITEEKDSFVQLYDVKVNHLIVAESKNLIKQFARQVNQNDIILALPDSSILNSKTLPKLLLASYRQNKAVIGYSIGTVRSGAVATTYTSPRMLATDLANSASQLIDAPEKLMRRHSNQFAVRLNLEVAKSLGIYVQDDKLLTRQIKDAIHENKINDDDILDETEI